MCGIPALLLHPQERSVQDWQAIRGVFSANLQFNEERGREATGVAIVQTDGQVSLLKQPLPASRLVNTSQFLSLLEAVNSQTMLLLGHTRLPTKGDPAFNQNNHPIQAGPVLGVHNGEVFNDDELFARFGFPRTAQVDSEIIFRLIESIDPALSDEGYLESVRGRIDLLQGQFAFLAYDLRRPGRLLALRHRNPLCALFHPAWNALVFSSRYVFLRKTFGRALAAEALNPDRLLVFDAASIPLLRLHPAACLHMGHR